MDVVVVKRGNSSHSSIQRSKHASLLSERRARTAAADQDAVVFEFASLRDPARYEPEANQVSLTASEHSGDGGLSAFDQSISKQNAALLATVTPAVARKYERLIGVVLNDQKQLQEFIHSVSKVLQLVAPTAQEAINELPHKEDPYEPAQGGAQETPLAIGNAVSFSLSGHLEATLAAVKAGTASIRPLPLEIEFSPEESNAPRSNLNDPLDLSSSSRIESATVSNHDSTPTSRKG